MNNLNVAKIQLNGDSYEINNGTNLNELLNKLKIQKNKVAIEVNGEIIEKNKYPNIILYKDDQDPFPEGYRLNDTWPSFSI